MAATIEQLRNNTAAIAGYTGKMGQFVLNTDDGSIVIMDGIAVGGKWRIQAGPSAAGTGGYSYSAPTTGTTIAAAGGERSRIIDPLAEIAALTVTLPSSPADGDTYELSTSQTIDALTVNAPAGAIVNGSGFMLTANGGASWRYRAANATWYRRY